MLPLEFQTSWERSPKKINLNDSWTFHRISISIFINIDNFSYIFPRFLKGNLNIFLLIAMMKTKMIKKSKENYISGSENTIFDKKEIIEKQQKLRKMF